MIVATGPAFPSARPGGFGALIAGRTPVIRQGSTAMTEFTGPSAHGRSICWQQLMAARSAIAAPGCDLMTAVSRRVPRPERGAGSAGCGRSGRGSGAAAAGCVDQRGHAGLPSTSARSGEEIRSESQSCSNDVGVREPGAIPGLTRSGEGDGQSVPPLPRGGGHWSKPPGRRSVPGEPESEDLLALAAIAAMSHAGSADGSPDRQVPGLCEHMRCPGPGVTAVLACCGRGRRPTGCWCGCG